MTTPKANAPLKTFCGDYYVGMTKAQAEKNGTYKKTIGLDFKDIDGCDGSKPDNVLSYNEIKEARFKESRRTTVTGFAQAAVGATIFGVSAMVECASFGTATPIATAGVYAGASLCTAGFAGIVTGIGEDDYTQDVTPEITSNELPQSRLGALAEGGKRVAKGLIEMGKDAIKAFKK